MNARKASLAQMEELHGVVASSLTKTLMSDPTDIKVLMAAMKFLKDNEVIVDKLELTPQNSLLERITEIANKPTTKLLEVDALLEHYV